MTKKISGLRRQVSIAKYEVRTILGMASTWQERLSMLRFLAMLYVARIVPGPSHDWTTTVRLHGTKYRVGVRTSEIYVFDEVYRDQMYDRIESYIPQRDWTVVDVGANIGIFAFLQAERGANVYAFEPNPDSFSRMAATMAEHRDRARVQLFESALSDHVGSGKLVVQRGGTTGGQIEVENKHDAEEIPISLTTLDAMTPGLGIERVDLLKMDIEGAEIHALRGARQTLDITDRIIAEYHSKELLRQFHEILDEAGFQEDLRFVYYPEEIGVQEEVGILYASKAHADVSS